MASTYRYVFAQGFQILIDTGDGREEELFLRFHTCLALRQCFDLWHRLVGSCLLEGRDDAFLPPRGPLSSESKFDKCLWRSVTEKETKVCRVCKLCPPNDVTNYHGDRCLSGVSAE